MEKIETQEINKMPQDYLLKFLTFSCFKETSRHYWIELTNSAVVSINHWFSNRIQDSKKHLIKVLDDVTNISPKDDYVFWRTIDETFENYYLFLLKIVNQAKNTNKTLVLWISFMWSYSFYSKVFDVINRLKAYYHNIIFVAWWADLNWLPDDSFLEILLDWWIDIVNIWWSKQFIDFFSNISSQDIFSRNKDWRLIIKSEKQIPSNLILSKEDFTLWYWTKEPLFGFYDRLKKWFYFTINNNNCLNSCGYCANSIHTNESTFKDIDVERAISHFNDQISMISDRDIAVEIQNPNPMQHIDRFISFMEWLDLAKVKVIWFFWDFLWIGNDKVYNKFKGLLERLLEKYPKITIITHFAVDAMHYQGDWEFLWRSMWKKIADEEKYQKAHKNFDDYIKYVSKNKRLWIPLNTIFHPNMDVKSYLERIDFIDNFWEITWWTVHKYSLVPHMHSKINQDHRWYFIPDYICPSFVSIEFLQNWDPSYWWNFYLNSYLLDWFTISNRIGRLWLFKNILKKTDFDSLWELVCKMSFIPNLLELLFRDISSIRTKIKWPVWLRHPFYMAKNYRLIKKKTDQDIDYIVEYITFVIAREKYLLKNNSSYWFQDIDEFLSELERFKDKFLSLKR